jgi:hypothetical protein
MRMPMSLRPNYIKQKVLNDCAIDAEDEAEVVTKICHNDCVVKQISETCIQGRQQSCYPHQVLKTSLRWRTQPPTARQVRYPVPEADKVLLWLSSQLELLIESQAKPT